MEYLKIIVDNLLSVVVTVIASVLMVLGRNLIKIIENKYKIQIDSEMEARFLGLVRSGISHAEEYTHKKLKVNSPTPSEEKLQKAIEFIKTEAKKAGMDEWIESHVHSLESIIEAQLNKVREK